MKLNQEVPKILQDYADWFKGINNTMNKDSAQYMVDMYWRSKLINNGQDSDLCTNKKL